jgi:hypothetical protein
MKGLGEMGGLLSGPFSVPAALGFRKRKEKEK